MLNYDSLDLYIKNAQIVDDSTVIGLNSTSLLYPVNPRAVMIRPIIGIYPCGIGFEELEKDEEFKLFPNPSHANLDIIYTLQEPGQVEILIRNAQGKLIDRVEFGYQNAGKLEHKLDLDNLENGIYFITINAGSQQKTERLIISK